MNRVPRQVLITGGSKGIGAACVKAFSSMGDVVFFTYRSRDESVDNLCRTSQATGIQSDATDAKAYPGLLNKILSTTESLDVLVNNVGDAIRRSSFLESDDQLWEDALNINLLTALRATRSFMPLLQRRHGGVIINISSIAGTTTGAGDSLHYGVAKAALDTFTKGLAREMDSRVRVCGVAPSAIDTDFQSRLSSPERVKKIIDQTPLGRIGEAEEVAKTVVFLSSTEASYISGDTILMSGGR